MKTLNRYYDVYPKVVQANTSATITIKDRYSQSLLRDGAEYEVRYYPVERFSPVGEYKFQEPGIIKAVNGTLTIEQYFKGEQEHILEIQEKENSESKKRVQFRIYSLEKDLFIKRPYKGDMHMHTHHSDGKESPAFVAACCRKIGLDFMAITDHGNYFPSIEAQEAYKDLNPDMLICRGEEVHPKNNPVHMINFGGSFSINELIRGHEETYFKEVNKLMESLDSIEDDDARFQIASCMWTFKKINLAGGLGIFCHPYWQIREGYHISDTVTSYMFNNQPFGAYEAIGGYHRFEEDSNTLQIARYHDERLKGKRIPLVGVSDSHGSENSDLFGWYFTIAFSESFDQQEIIDSIKNCCSVAVEAIPGESVRAYGEFRFVKYALFLLNEVFPEHDELCFDEGKLMLAHIEGDNQAKTMLDMLKGRVKGLYNKLWAVNL